MENEVVTKKTSYFTGVIGALIGGIIASIPWILVYVYGNMMLSLLAVLIAAGEFYGYKLFKGKIDKKLPLIIMILAVVIVTIITLLIIPAMLLQKEGINVTIDSIKVLYSYSEFSAAIIKDYLIALIFTVLGASVVTANIKKQLLNEDGKIELDLSNNDELTNQRKNAIDSIKPIFERYNALNKENTMTKEEVLAEIEDENAKKYFKHLVNYRIIKKEKGKFYYCEENEKNTKQKTSTGLILGLIIVLAAIIVITSISSIDTNISIKTEGNGDVSFAIPGDWDVLNEYNQEDGWTYYKYISNIDTAYENVQLSDGTIDYKKYPSTIGIAYDTEMSDGNYNSIEDLKDILENYINEDLRPEEYNLEITTSQKGYDTLKAKIKYTSEPEEIDYLYYIYKDGKLAYITATTFNINDEEELKEDSEMILNSFVWKN